MENKITTKNAPERIYLQTGAEEDCDFNECSTEDVTWCADKIFESDLEYVSVEHQYKRIKELEEILSELVTLKEYKNTFGKDAYYNQKQPETWAKAKQALQNK